MYNICTLHSTYYIVIKSLCLSSIQEKAHVSDVIGPQPRQATSLIGQSSVDKLAVSQPLQLSTHWISTFGSFVQLNSEIINISRIRQTITKTRRRRQNKQSLCIANYTSNVNAVFT